MTREALRDAEAAYQAALAVAGDLRAARDAAIREALSEKRTHAWIAEATGLTRGRINQLAQAAKVP